MKLLVHGDSSAIFYAYDRFRILWNRAKFVDCFIQGSSLIIYDTYLLVIMLLWDYVASQFRMISGCKKQYVQLYGIILLQNHVTQNKMTVIF